MEAIKEGISIHKASKIYAISFSEERYQTIGFQLGGITTILHHFNKTTKLAVEDWMSGFMKRNCDIIVRSPEPTSIAKKL